MILNPKKIIGSLGRRYGGKPFRVFRDGFYDILSGLGHLRDSIMVFGGILPFDSTTRHIDRTLYSDDKAWPSDSSYDSKNDEDRVTPGVICILDGSFTHGGLTDRIRGILSAYKEASRRNLPFYIFWKHPFPLEHYLLPNEVDWRIPECRVCRLRKYSRMVVADDLTDSENRLRLKAAFLSRKRQLHLYTNADIARGDYRTLFSTLFKPSAVLQEAIEFHKKKMTPKYHAFAFRFLTLLNDFTDFKVPPLSEREQEELIEKVTSELKRLIKDVPADKSVFITGDSIRFLNHVRNIDPRIYIVEGEVKHIDLDQHISQRSELKTFVDQFLLMGAEKVTLLRTGRMYKSGFSRFAAEVGGAEFVDHSF